MKYELPRTMKNSNYTEFMAQQNKYGQEIGARKHLRAGWMFLILKNVGRRGRLWRYGGVWVVMNSDD